MDKNHNFTKFGRQNDLSTDRALKGIEKHSALIRAFFIIIVVAVCSEMSWNTDGDAGIAVAMPKQPDDVTKTSQ